MHAIGNSRFFSSCRFNAALLGLLALGLGLAGGVLAASGTPTAPTKSIAQITIDDDGQGLKYPSIVFFDPTEEEIYLVNGGTSRVVVYGPDFYPRISIGTGRSVAYPRGIYVTNSGQVYISQAVNRANPVPRITVLNGAFFVDREILLDEIPEVAEFPPRNLAVSRDGTVYLTSEKARGVMVLDREGNFLRWLRPMDIILDRKAIAEAEKVAEEEASSLQGEAEAIDIEGDESPDAEESLTDIPEEFRPKTKEEQGEGPVGPGLGPVRIAQVVIDSQGNLYLLSTETSKVYVYNSEETFLYSFGQKGGTPRTMSQPRSLAIDEKNKLIYVVDYTRHTILVYDMSGKWLFEVGGRGFKPGYFNYPVSIGVNRQGQIIVADLFNKRVQVLEVEYEGFFPTFGGANEAVPESPEAEATEEAGQAPPATGSPALPEGEASVEAEAEAVAPAQPEGAVEDVIMPAQDLPSQPATETGPESASGTPAEQPAVENGAKPDMTVPAEQPPAGGKP